ncbi:hypothetical protein MBM_02659 [Drepanopeziza brunnea f. sp. 'multigermtubi' MB_m1]|uniref:Uncharacterized protein n=1 Tax=Marssonina brunnea f. sp. multigermtubi (strain MB_m1) TaxID=1072389 RepID=K1X320_MARBU|nr:uncharacterized protein MBM_02659 [Drepanopeziza brunnea f. sp. 'multigermtubi' MB_m1]EKD19422.1 hypothetical protein MBM_02659 [Drepanopeziza brunnea f. sp. 'multigermtubi' MB_m1]
MGQKLQGAQDQRTTLPRPNIPSNGFNHPRSLFRNPHMTHGIGLPPPRPSQLQQPDVRPRNIQRVPDIAGPYREPLPVVLHPNTGAHGPSPKNKYQYALLERYETDIMIKSEAIPGLDVPPSSGVEKCEQAYNAAFVYFTYD